MNSIKNDVYRLFSTNELKNELHTILHDNEDNKCKTKYFVISISSTRKKLGSYNYLWTIVDDNQKVYTGHNPYDNSDCWNPTGIISILATDDDDNIENFKSNKRNIDKNNNNMYWLDNDDKKDVFTLLGL